MIQQRSYELEILDQEEQDPAELAASLEQVSQANRLFGGTRALRRHLAAYRRRGEDLLLLDVGAGNGDTALDLLRWAGKGGASWHAVALDPHAATARVAAERVASSRVSVLRGDGLRLPFADGAVDVAVAVLVLHHLQDEDAVRLVAEMSRVARRLVLVNDLERHPVNHTLARLMAATLWRGNRITRNDAPLSVLRSFTPGELLQVGHDAGLGAPRVTRHLPFRLVLEGTPRGVR
jgi:ubiquinone/menaquinone biosynthesis C-methylase UbiE